MGAIKYLDIIPSIDPSFSSSEFIVEAGWGTPSFIVGVVRLVASKPLKEAKLVLEFQGESETFWVGSKVRKSGDPPGETFARRFQLVATVVRNSKEALEPNEFGSITLPFKIHLPAQKLPPSFTDSRGCIKYSLKSTLTWSETLKLSRPAHTVTVPITIVMPRAHRLKLIRTPLTLEYDTPYDPDKCTCMIRLPTRVYIPGQQFTIQFAIPYVPPGRFITAAQVSIETNTTYRSVTSDATKRNRNAMVWNPFPLAIARELPAPGELGISDSNSPSIFFRTVQLVTDPKHHQITLESSIITVCSLIKFQVFLDGDKEPHFVFDTPITVIPADTIKETTALQALKLSHKQIRPISEIALSASNQMLACGYKRSSFSTAVSAKRVSSNIDDSITLRSMSSKSETLSVNSLKYNCIDQSSSTHRSTFSSSHSDLHSTDSYDHILNMPFMSTRSTSSKSLDTQIPSSLYQNTLKDTSLTHVKSNSSMHTSSDSVSNPSPVRNLAPLLENYVVEFASKECHDGIKAVDTDSDPSQLLSIDEISNRLANLTRKEVGLSRVSSLSSQTTKSTESIGNGKAAVDQLIVQLDSKNTGTFSKHIPIYRSTENMCQRRRSATRPSLIINTSQIMFTRKSTENVETSVDSESSTARLQDLLDSLESNSESPMNQYVCASPILKRHSNHKSTGQSSLAHGNRFNQIQKIDDLLESLLELEKKHEIHEKSSNIATSDMPDITLPIRSSSKLNQSSTFKSLHDVYQNHGSQMPPTPPQISQRQSSIDLSYNPSKSVDLQQLYNKSSSALCTPTSAVSCDNTSLVEEPSTYKNSDARFIVLNTHVPKRPDELHLLVGDIVCIQETFRDGWCWGYNVATRCEGSFPMKEVQLYDSI
ncbi:hypothetical protein MT418_003136 [Batrachochytrium dendrobatidis]